MLLSGTLLSSDGERIAYDHYRNGHNQAVVIAHGFYNSKDSVLLQEIKNKLLDEYDVFMFDFRGHGRSSGVFYWTSKEEQDLEAGLDYLKGKYDKIGLISFSLGASVSIDVLSRRESVDSFISVSAVSDVDKVDYRLWELDWENDIVYSLFSQEGRKGKGVRPGPFWLKKKKPVEEVKKISIPILYIHGDKDWVIRPWHSQALYAQTVSAKKDLVIIKGGPHAEYLMRGFAQELMGLIRGWFVQTLNHKKGEGK